MPWPPQLSHPPPVSIQGWGLGTQADGPSPTLELATCLAHVASSSSFDEDPAAGSGIAGFWPCFPSRAGSCTRRSIRCPRRPALSAVTRAAGLRASRVSPALRVFLAVTHWGAGCAHAAVELSRCRLEAGREGQALLRPGCEGGGGTVTNAGPSAPTSLRVHCQWAFYFSVIFSVSN